MHAWSISTPPPIGVDSVDAFRPGIGTDELGLVGLLLHVDVAQATRAYEAKYPGHKLVDDLNDDTDDIFTSASLKASRIAK